MRLNGFNACSIIYAAVTDGAHSAKKWRLIVKIRVGSFLLWDDYLSVKQCSYSVSA
jgi:hypothetical protein